MIKLLRPKKRFIATSTYGQGSAWMYIWAYSKEDIEARFPEFWVFETPPKKFESSEAAQKYAETLTSDLYQPAVWLQRYMDFEQKDHWYFKNPNLKPPYKDT